MTLPAQDIVERLRDYGLTLEESVVICDRRVVDEAAGIISRLTADNEALRNERDEAKTALHEYLMIDKTAEKQLADQAALIEQVQGISEGRARDALHLRNTLAVHQDTAKKWERLCVALEADKAKLSAQAEDARAAHHKTSHKAVKRLRALWREKQAAESRITALEAEVGRLRAELTRIVETKMSGHARIIARNALGDRP